MRRPDQRQEIGRPAPAVVVEGRIEPRVIQRQRGERVLGEELRRVQQVPLERSGKERRIADLAGEHPQQHVPLHPHELVVAVAVVKEPVGLVETLRPQRPLAGLGLRVPRRSVFAQLLRHPGQIPALADDVGGQVRCDERQDRARQVELLGVVPLGRVRHVPEPRRQIVPGVIGAERLHRPGAARVAPARQPGIVPAHGRIHLGEKILVAPVELVVRPHRAGQRRHRLDLREGGAVLGQLVGKQPVLALVPRKAQKGVCGDLWTEAAQQFRIDGAGAFEPAAEIDAAFLQDRLRPRRRLDAGGKFPHRVVVAPLHRLAGGGKAHGPGTELRPGTQSLEQGAHATPPVSRKQSPAHCAAAKPPPLAA